jgi:hypothetical protein
MKKIILRLTSMLALLSLTTFAMADEWSKEQTAAWLVVTQSWEDEVAENGKWPSNYAHKDLMAWGASWPQPRDSSSVTKWSRFDQQAGKTLIYELFPVAVVVVGNTAVVNYNSVTMAEDYEMKRKRSTMGLIETLVKDGNNWKFLSLTSFEIKSGE